MSKCEFARFFPNLREEDYEKRSEQTDRYNCIAFALGDEQNYWWPTPRYACYWPPGFERTNTLPVLQKICEWFGYRACDNGEREAGFEKIALYADPTGVQHAARQLQSGVWLSKIGELEDIEHTTLESLESDDYGKVALYMKRYRKDWAE
jgi:hypothetical protein